MARPDLLLAVRALYGAIERFDAAAAAALAVDRSGLRAINALERGAASPGQLGAALGLTSGSVTALLDRLTAAGHVERRISPEDGRRRDALLTPPARARAGEIYGRLGAAIEARFAALEPPARAALVAGLLSLTEAFDAAGGGAAPPTEAAVPRRPQTP